MATRLKDIKAFAFDVDGVMTDGSILALSNGDLLRIFDAKDGFAIRMAILAGYPVAVITGGRSHSIVERFKASGIKEEDIYLHSRDKLQDFNDFCKRYGLEPADVVFVGDDLPDIPVMLAAGIGACPDDAASDVQAIADYISEAPGGKGCIRELFEKILKKQGRWNFDVSAYKNRF